MNIFLQIAITLAAASVIFGLVWSIYGKLRTPVRSVQKTEVHTILSVRDGAEGLEQTVEGLIWLQKNGTIEGQILIADCGMDEEGRELARLAVKKYGKIAICKAEDVKQWIVEVPVTQKS